MSLSTPTAPSTQSEAQVAEQLLPRHIGIMMDGNGRWARARGLPRLAGHRQGTENVRRVLNACEERGIRLLTLYVFSTENWGRPRSEIVGFFRLLAEVIDREVPGLVERGVRLRHLGSLDGIPPRLAAKVRKAVELTRQNQAYELNIAFNYGGRQDILSAVRSLARRGVDPSRVTEDVFSAHLSTADLPDMDLIIRTGAEMRLSNFFPWQACRAVYYSSPVPWPEFDAGELDQALAAFALHSQAEGLRIIA